jgi:hypothetical protein
MSFWNKIALMSVLVLGSCKKQRDPVTPVIPICHAEPTVPGSNTIVWTSLPTIPTTQLLVKESEKLYRNSFPTGFYGDSLSTKQYRFTIVASTVDNLSSPTDLDRNPIRPNELWISNYGESFKSGQYSRKAFTLTVVNPAQSSQFSVVRKDKERFTEHFFSYPTSLAFNKDGYWANTSYLNNNGTNGPTLWTSDFTVYADSIKYITNGSHNSMLHESLISLGIAADETNTFWVLDGTAGDIVSYNFGKGHYPGGDDHTDGTIRRYSLLVKISPVEGIPSHVCYDPSSKWLYIVDTKQHRIIRLKTDSGSVTSSKQGIDNPKEYSVMAATSELFLDNLPFQLPSGIDTDGTNLYVSDYETGKIGVFNLATKSLTSVINTRDKGTAGLLLSADHTRLWFVNTLQNRLVQVEL